jgi:very-short-patch-repair endonuclease
MINIQLPNQKYASQHATKLWQALRDSGIDAELEYFDGHKTVDIAILPSRIYIEVDGLHHFTEAEQIIRDFKRAHYSDGDDFNTFYVTNQIIELYLEDVVKALVEVVALRMPR